MAIVIIGKTGEGLPISNATEMAAMLKTTWALALYGCLALDYLRQA